MNKVHQRESFKLLLLLICIWGIYILLMPVNRTENDDGYNYAWQVLHGTDAELFQSRYPLFLPFERLVYSACRFLHLHADAYMTMVWVSSVFAIGALYFFYCLLRRRFMLSMRSSVHLTLLLAFSYGFWRYAVEAELYSISHFLIFLSLYLLTKPAKPWLSVFLASLTGALAVLLYKPNFIPLFLAFPFYLIFIKNSKALLLYLIAGAAGILSGYALIFLSVQVSQPTYLSYLFSGSDGNAGNPLMAFFVFLSDIASSNFLYGFPWITSLIHSRFPGNMIVEEILTASFYPVLNKTALVTSLLLAITALILLVRRFGLSQPSPDTQGQRSLLRVMWLWLIVYWMILSFLDPNSPEPWMMLVPPLFFIIGFELVFRLESPERPEASNISFFLIAVLIVHNLVAAVIPNLNKASDYNKNQAEALLSAVSQNDTILCFGSYTEFYYLRYYTHARVINASEDLSALEKEFMDTEKIKGKFLLTPDAVMPTDVIRYRNNRNVLLLQQFVSSHSLSKPQSSMASGAYYILYP